jgi:multicomponent Na+:H+ antiporter subunit G
MNIVVIVLLAAGLFFFLVGIIGIIRFPDFFSRMHPAGMLDTMGLLLTMLAIAVHILFYHFSYLSVFSCLKILLIVVFVYITSPIASHAIMDAGVRAGLKPWTKENQNNEEA